MASLKAVLFLGVCLSAWIVITAEQHFGPKVENVHWLSLDFKTILKWTVKKSNHTYQYNVRFSEDGDLHWNDCEDCSAVSDLECDFSNDLRPFDRTYTADIQTLPDTTDYDPEELPHTLSPPFNPYKDSKISAVQFTVEPVDERRVTVNITDTLTSVHVNGKQLTIRDIFKKDLKYKISYYKSGSTGKRDIKSDSSMAEVSKLDAGQSYCFMVAAYISSRTTNQGAWSQQLCTEGYRGVLQELSIGAWVGAVFILLTVIILISTVTVLCYRRYKQRYETTQTSQASTPV
ncbi:tissue factor-like [Hippoglossus hippoglossus]|uniref:tissue factor-like n=1 Tax=Hippoglossus hippoglossus TaxID=8267 RepID=UPI00148C1B9A|nr:tissue factor-like [Hippoglossus hippoglossus]